MERVPEPTWLTHGPADHGDPVYNGPDELRCPTCEGFGNAIDPDDGCRSCSGTGAHTCAVCGDADPEGLMVEQASGEVVHEDCVYDCDGCGQATPLSMVATVRVPATGEGTFCEECRGLR